MAKWGSCDFSQLVELQTRIQKLEDAEFDKFCRDTSKELAARLLALVIPRTPTKQGTLRRGWIAKTHEEAAGGSGQLSVSAGRQYAQTLPVVRSDGVFTVEVINPVKYAEYVEYGHRTGKRKTGGETDTRGWVYGRFFLTISEMELDRLAPGIVEKKIEKKLREVFGNS